MSLEIPDAADQPKESIPEQSEFTHSPYLVAAGHLQLMRLVWPMLFINLSGFWRSGHRSQKQRNTALTLVHAQAIHCTSN